MIAINKEYDIKNKKKYSKEILKCIRKNSTVIDIKLTVFIELHLIFDKLCHSYIDNIITE